MYRATPLLACLVIVAFAAGRWSHADDEPRTPVPEVVHALGYRIVWVESAVDLSHGGGRWVHEFFFPEAKVTATLVFESQASTDDVMSYETRPRIYVGRSDRPRTDLVGISDAPALPAREVDVPASLAKALVAFAELNERYRTEGGRLGAEFSSALGLEPIEGYAGPGADTAAPDVK